MNDEAPTRFRYVDLVGQPANVQATALLCTYARDADEPAPMTIGDLRQLIAGLPDDAVVVVPTRESREHGAVVGKLVPVWITASDIFVQDEELDTPDDPSDPDAGFPRTGVLYGIMFDPRDEEGGLW